MKEMEERARRRQQQQSNGREGVASGEMVSYLASSVQPVLAQALLELDQEQPRPAEVAAALQRVVRGPEELRGAPPASVLQSEAHIFGRKEAQGFHRNPHSQDTPVFYASPPLHKKI